MILFTGTSEVVIDAKSRVAIPAKYRHQLLRGESQPAWVCVPWPTRSLRIYTEDMFNDIAQGVNQTLVPDEVTSELESSLYGFAERLEMDSAGRICLPRQLLDVVQLGSVTDCVMIGARNRLELHDRAAWMAGISQRFQALPDLVSRLNGKSMGRSSESRNPDEQPGQPLKFSSM